MLVWTTLYSYSINVKYPNIAVLLLQVLVLCLLTPLHSRLILIFYWYMAIAGFLVSQEYLQVCTFWVMYLQLFIDDSINLETWMFLFLFVVSAPFTIQRVCELLIEPTKHYKTVEKFMRAVEKVSDIFYMLAIWLY